MKNKKLKHESSAIMRLLKYMKPHRAKLIGAILLMIVAVVAMSLAPLFMGFSINYIGEIFSNGFTQEAASGFVRFLIVMVICYVTNSVLSYLSSHLLINATQHTVFDLRKQIDHKLSKLPLNYYDTTTYGDILSRVTNDVDKVSESLEMSLQTILNAFFTIIMVLIMMIGISGWLTIIALIPVPVLLIICTKIANKSQKQFDIQMDKTGELNGYVEEYYGGHNVVSLCVKEDQVNKGFDVIDEQLYQSSKKGMFLAGVLYPLTIAINNIGYVLVAVFGAFIAILGGLSIGMIQAFTQYLLQFSMPISEVMEVTSLVQTTESAAARIFEFLDEEEEIPDTSTPEFPNPLCGAVNFDHVRFGYVPHKILIHDLDIRIPAGSKTAIVGPTGAGKTTLVNLIMRFYDVKGGAIRIDGIDIRDMKRDKLRDIFGMVLQETWLYSGSIMENIRYGKLDATDEEVVAAAKAARADAFIRTLPGAYNFVLQEGASNIAQGQRQLLTIARAFLNDPPIMILDEATSSVDTRTEVLVQEAMNNAMQGRTSFIIAHRLSTIKDANTILYMQDGDILEVGNHESLMEKNGLYAKLYNSQFADE